MRRITSPGLPSLVKGFESGIQSGSIRLIARGTREHALALVYSALVVAVDSFDDHPISRDFDTTLCPRIIVSSNTCTIHCDQ